jgi:hypothetical protein
MLSDYYSSDVEFVSKLVKTLCKDGSIATHEVVSMPSKFHMLKALSLFLYSVAVAIFISIFVAMKIEKQQRDQHDKELKALQSAINIDVFDSLFSTLIDKELFDVIKEQIIENKVIRKDAKWFYDFTIKDDNTIQLRQTVKYKLHNISRSEVVDPVKLEAAATSNQIISFKQAYCEINGYKAVSYDSDNPAANQGVNINKEGDKQSIEFSITIPPKADADFTTVFVNEYKDRVIDAYFTKYPIINASLFVTYPDGYTFNIFQSMSSVLRCTLSDKTRQIYELEGGVLPRQGFVYYLNKTDNSVPNQEEAAA